MNRRIYPTGKKSRALAPFAAVAMLAFALAGCTANPATGRPSLGGLMSPAEEIRLGREEHPKIIAEYGRYNDEAVQRYVSSIGELLVKTTENPDRPMTFTVLDTDMVNAFAIPGYVYITRGIMALAENEAELASVVGHEIGHNIARHVAERYGQQQLAGLGAMLAGILTGSQAVGNLAQTGAGLYVLSYSREQESEADMLGVRYMSRAGFDPNAMSSFFSKLRNHETLEAKIAGKPDKSEQFSFLANHPRTSERISAAVAEAQKTLRPTDPIVGRDIYLDKIQNLVYGDSPAQGIVRGREFLHPRMRIRFEVPPNYRLINKPDKVVAVGPGDAAIVFDRAEQSIDGTMLYYMQNFWPARANPEEVEAIAINGLDAAAGRKRLNTRNGPVEARFIAIRKDLQTIFRFVFLTPVNLADQLAEDLKRTTYSFRLLSAEDAAKIRPLRLKVVTVRPGDSVAALAAKMPFDSLREERLRVLNGLDDNAVLRAGERVKIVVD